MITPSELTQKDVGRHVVYCNPGGGLPQQGTLTSWNDHLHFRPIQWS